MDKTVAFIRRDINRRYNQNQQYLLLVQELGEGKCKTVCRGLAIAFTSAWMAYLDETPTREQRLLFLSLLVGRKEVIPSMKELTWGEAVELKIALEHSETSARLSVWMEKVRDKIER